MTRTPFDAGSQVSDVGDPLCYEVCASPDRGLGVFATRDIQAGTRIIAEKPLMVISRGHYMKRDIESAFDGLSSDDQAKYMTLASAHGQSCALWPSRIHESIAPEEKQRIRDQHDARTGAKKTILSIMMTNAMPWGARLEGLAVFETACRFNHSCVPNAYFSWNNNIKRETIHAVKAIEKGEEVTVAYCDPLYDEAIRRRELQHYGFSCDCKACYGPIDGFGDLESTSFASKSRERKYRLCEIDQTLGRSFYWPSEGMVALDEKRHISLLLEEIGLLRAEGLISPKLGNSYFQLAKLCCIKDDYAFAAKAARRGYEIFVVCLGRDAPVAIEKSNVLEEMQQRLH